MDIKTTKATTAITPYHQYECKIKTSKHYNCTVITINIKILTTMFCYVMLFGAIMHGTRYLSQKSGKEKKIGGQYILTYTMLIIYLCIMLVNACVSTSQTVCYYRLINGKRKRMRMGLISLC